LGTCSKVEENMSQNFDKLPENQITKSKMTEESNRNKFLANSGSQNNAKQFLVSDFGQIESLALQNMWLPIKQADDVIGQSRRQEFKQENGASLSLKEKGYRIAEADGTVFTDTLKKAFDPQTKKREINLQTGEGKKEYAKLMPVLAEDLISPNRFQPESVCVREINGKNVLEVTGICGNVDANGNWTSSGQKITSIYIDKFGKGDAIQEIHLESSAKIFDLTKAGLEKALKSLMWKP